MRLVTCFVPLSDPTCLTRTSRADASHMVRFASRNADEICRKCWPIFSAKCQQKRRGLERSRFCHFHCRENGPKQSRSNGACKEPGQDVPQGTSCNTEGEDMWKQYKKTFSGM